MINTLPDHVEVTCDCPVRGGPPQECNCGDGTPERTCSCHHGHAERLAVRNLGAGLSLATVPSCGNATPPALKPNRPPVEASIYGYVLDKATGKIAVHPEEARAVRRIFELVETTDISYGGIAMMLIDEGFPTKHGGSWTHVHVIKIVKRRAFYEGRAAARVPGWAKRWTVDKYLRPKQPPILGPKKKGKGA